jgi:hypothetical protein
MYNNNPKSNTPKDIFSSDDLEITKTEGWLALLWRTVLRDVLGDYKLTGNNRLTYYNSMVTKWVTHPFNKMTHDRNKQATLRGNIHKQFAANKMSHNVFLLMFQIFECEELEVVVRPKWRTRGGHRTTEHSIVITGLLPSEPSDFSQKFSDALKEGQDDNTEPSAIHSENRAEGRSNPGGCLRDDPEHRKEPTIGNLGIF